MGKKRLYKYISLDNDVDLNNKKLSALTTSKAWLSTFAALNDPFEAKATFYNKEQLHNQTGARNLSLNLMGLALNYLNDKYVVYSLTENSYDCMPMWAHYANNHRGFCIEYEIDSNFYDKNDVMCEMQKVEYSESKKSINMYIEEQLRFYEYMKSSNFNEPTVEEQERIIDGLTTAQSKNFFTKHISWNYENEYRLVYTAVPHGDFPHGQPELIKHNLEFINSKLSELQKEKGILVELSKIGLSISKIYVGLECSVEYTKFLNRISHSLGCGNAHRLSVKEQTQEFRVITTEITDY